MSTELTADDYGILDNANSQKDGCIRYDLKTAPAARIEEVEGLSYDGAKLFERLDQANTAAATFKITKAGIDVLASRDA